MLEFEILQELEPNAEILEIIKNYEHTVKNGKIKHLKATNLQLKNTRKEQTSKLCNRYDKRYGFRK